MQGVLLFLRWSYFGGGFKVGVSLFLNKEAFQQMMYMYIIVLANSWVL